MTKTNKHWARSLSDAINMGTSVVASIAVGVLGGRWLDNKFDTDPWFFLIGSLLGVATGIKVMWDRAMASSGTDRTKGDDET